MKWSNNVFCDTSHRVCSYSLPALLLPDWKNLQNMSTVQSPEQPTGKYQAARSQERGQNQPFLLTPPALETPQRILTQDSRSKPNTKDTNVDRHLQSDIAISNLEFPTILKSSWIPLVWASLDANSVTSIPCYFNIFPSPVGLQNSGVWLYHLTTNLHEHPVSVKNKFTYFPSSYIVYTQQQPSQKDFEE